MNDKEYTKGIEEQAVELTSQEILDLNEITEYTAEDIIKDFENAMTYKVEQARVFKILDAADRSEIWKTYNKKIPSHIQTPVNNLITVIREATKASIMPTEYAGEFRSMTMESKDLAYRAGKFFHNKWESAELNEVNNEAADYAYLHGTSGVLFGWNEDIVDYTDTAKIFSAKTGSQIQAKAYHPSNVFPDPSATNVGEMSYLFFSEKKSKNFLKSIPRFADAIKNIESAYQVFSEDVNYMLDKDKTRTDKTVTFLTCYRRVRRATVDPVYGVETFTNAVDIIYLAGRSIIGVSKGIQPNTIPFVPLYDEATPNNFWGVSKCYKVLSLVTTLNKIDSTEATAYFKHQNPTEFINSLSGLNIPDYQRNRNNPNLAFAVNCDPKLVSAYAAVPDIPKNIDTFRQYLLQCIQQVSGVDSAYLGRSYGSIQTTGGIQQAVDRATMRDNNRIKLIDKFIKAELELMTQFFIMHGGQESFYTESNNNPEANGEYLEFNPVELLGKEDVQIVVSNCAPRSNASYEEAAFKIMEMQLKYDPASKGYPDFITPQEFLEYMNFPKDQKALLIERMTNQMTNMKAEEYMAVLTAVGTLTQGGMAAEEALMMVAEMMQKTPMGQIPATMPSNVAPE